LQQIILESSAGALQTVEQVLALAADSNEDTWLDRLEEMSGLDMKTLAELYADGNASLSESAAESLLMSKYGDAAEMLESEYQDIQMEMIWYTNYMDTNGLRIQDGETDDAYSARLDAYFDEIKQRDGEDAYDDITGRFYGATPLYTALLMVPYEGEWGETLFEFFCNQNGGDYEYAEDTPAFLPFAIALSEGQRAGLQFLSFRTLLQLGVSCDDTSVISDAVPDLGDLESVSIYSGINRAIFRSGVALTSRAMMDKSRGQSPYDQIWDAKGVFSIASLGTFAVGTVVLVIGAEIYAKYTHFDYAAAIATENQTLGTLRLSMTSNEAARDGVMKQFMNGAIGKEEAETRISALVKDYNRMVGEETTAKQKINSRSEMQDQAARMSKAARWIMGIGGVMMLASAAMAGYRLYKYYNRTFLPIPLYIVDEADIVSYTTDKNGNEVKNIDFDQYVYYEVVKCDRQDIGVNSKAQDGVDQYAEWGCGDAADLSCDIGKQWLALYTVKSDKKGAPILADSLKLQYGSDAVPAGCTVPLHFFTYTHAADLGDLAYAFNNNKYGVYFFWDTDANAFTATAFTGGQLALAGVGGLAVGILGATVVTMMTRKRKETPEAPTVA
ncbi:MAG: hypothetical protein IJ906_09265, partial [Oscillospiraceae bacterium]|nr:hypothetical protein [Oscillospiraceae bacterium]